MTSMTAKTKADTAPPAGQSASEHAYGALRQAIASGEFAGGQRLTEQMLSERFGISRTPIRDALRRLEMEGLIAAGTGRGFRVAEWTRDEIDQVFNIRAMLESYAIERAARLATDEQIEELGRLSELMIDHTPPRSDEDFRVLSDSNERFHKLIIEAAKSDRLARLISMTIDMALVFRTYKMYSERDLQRSSLHHREMAEALRARSPNWAASVMRSHLLAAAGSVEWE